MKSIKSKENLPLKMTPFVCVLCDKKERGFSLFFSSFCIEEILCLYRPLGYHWDPSI